ncbi:hypothetical protein STEG23_003162, partial [Scotinomys teguina]
MSCRTPLLQYDKVSADPQGSTHILGLPDYIEYMFDENTLMNSLDMTLLHIEHLALCATNVKKKSL